MKRGVLREAPNYTNAALIMGGLNLFWIMTVIWAMWGLPTVLAVGYLLDRLIRRIGRRS